LPTELQPFAIDHGGPVDRPFEPFPESALEGSITARFDEIVRRFPKRLAIQDAVQEVTYEELAARVGRIAAAVAERTAGRNGPVAILLPNDARLPTSMVAVIAAGRAFIPLDADHPIDRNSRIASHAEAAAVVSVGELASRARSLFAAELPVIDLETFDAGATRPDIRQGPDDLAYILYTSGSTGRPKGVFHSHRNCLHDVLTLTNNAHIDCEDRIGLFYAGVIGAARRTFTALLNGASLHIMPPRELGAERLVEELDARGVTIFHSVPTLFRRVAGAVKPGERLKSVRIVRLSGDRSDWGDWELFRRAFAPDAHLGVNLGSTEVSSTYAHWYVDDSVRRAGERLPVGRVMQGVQVEVVDPDGAAVPPGETGEFVVRSRYIALGYWREPELTARTFSTDPDDPAVRIFRTGDMGLVRPDGLLEFVGRKDQLIKLRGHRIEPSEVESALRGLAGVGEAAVVVRTDEHGRPRAMVAYVELRRETQGMLPRHILAMLSRVLPAYMHPATVFMIEALPKLANFKIDRAALAALDAARDDGAAARKADPLLDDVASAFEAVLGIRGATPEDNLLSLGGDSLQAVGVALELQNRTGVTVPQEVFAEIRSIRDLAEWISRVRPPANGGLHRQDDVPL
jgi:amino acid adenylation domain-containing protein